MSPSHSVADLLLHPQKIADLEPGALHVLLLELSSLLVAITADLASRARAETDDRLLSVDEAGRVLGLSLDSLYRSKDLRSCRVRIAGRVLFSAHRIQQLIERRRA